MHRPLVAVLTLALCASAFAADVPDVLLLGEQHDATGHAQLERNAISSLAANGSLAGVVLEMAPAGRSTAQLPASASEKEVRTALEWSELGWPWQRYREPVMAAVRAGVPVWGSDLPRAQLAVVARDMSFDATVSSQVMQAQRDAVRSGHCGLLPENQIAPMARIQVARDDAMAHAIERLRVPGKTLIVITGKQHADAALGIPLHLPATLRVSTDELPAQQEARDYCEDLRKNFGRAAGTVP